MACNVKQGRSIGLSMKHFDDQGEIKSTQAGNIFQIKCTLILTEADVDAKFLGEGRLFNLKCELCFLLSVRTKEVNLG